MAKNVTAPRRWKSSPNSPSTQLAYVTQPEIDLLVKANLHGSMKGKPNKGPKGIISLDGGGSDYRSSRRSAAPGGTGGRTGAPDPSAPSRDYGGGGGGGEEQRNQASRDERQRQYKAELDAKHAAQSAADDKKAQQVKDANQQRIDDMREKQAEQDRRREVQTGKKQGLGGTALDFLAKIGHGDVQEGYIGDEAFKKTQPAGQDRMRSQFDRLSAKYGPGFANTTQGRELMDYLSGVPVERGGGLGARDPSYGGSAENIDPTLEAQRQELLRQISATGTPFGSGTDMASQLEGIRREGIGADLTPDQFFNFTQQLMAADPTPGNMAYKQARPFSSGQLAQGIAGLAPGIGTIGRIAGSALGGANEMLGGIPGEALGAGKQMFTDLRTKAGFGQGLKSLLRTPQLPEPFGTSGRAFAGAPSVRPDGDRGGVIDAAQSVVNQASPYGSLIGSPGTAGGFIDSDGDGVDDRYQTAAGQPNQGPGGDIATPSPFEVGEITQPVLPQSPFASSDQPFNIPIGGGQNPNLQNWYKNLGIMENVYS